MAANTDLLRKSKSLFSTTLSTGIGTGTSDTLTPATVTGLPTDTAITITIDRVDSAGVSLGSQVERIIGVISGGNLTSYTRAIDNTTEQAHAGGAVIEMVWNAEDWNDMVDWALVSHNQSGYLKTNAITSSMITASNVTASKIAASGVIPGNLAASSVLAGTIAASAITLGTLAASSVSAGNLNFVATGSTDGWKELPYTLVYVSASSVKVEGADVTAIFSKGTRIKFTQTSAKPFVVTSSSFSTDTTINVAVNTDYTVANAAITAPYYSYEASPQGYPSYFNDTGGWDLEFGGTNTANTTVAKCKFAMIGKTVHAMISYTFQGDPGTGALTITPTTGLAPETAFEPKGIGRYWNGSVAVMMQVDFDGTDLIPRGVTGTAMSDTSPSTIANGHDLEFNLTYQVA